MGLLDFLTKTIGVDPGSQNLRLIHNNELIFNERAELSIDPATKKVSGFGNESIHVEPNKVIRPVNMVIADFHGFEHLLRGSLKRALNEQTWFPANYSMYFSLPMTATEVEKRAYRDSAEHAGAKEVWMIHQPCSSAIGMGILFEKKDFILIDFSARGRNNGICQLFTNFKRCHPNRNMETPTCASELRLQKSSSKFV
jgi:rod shape-determining protein MreB